MWEYVIVLSSCSKNTEITFAVEYGFHCERILWQKAWLVYIEGGTKDFAKEMPYFGTS
jgi:hypothetical protein